MTSRREFLGMAAAFGGARLFAAVPDSCRLRLKSLSVKTQKVSLSKC